METEIKDKISFIITPKKMKQLEINLPKYVQDLYAEIYKMLFKKIKEDLNKLRYVLYSWFEKPSILKVSLLPKLSYSFNEIPFKTLRVFVEHIQAYYNFLYGKAQVKINLKHS